MYHNTWHLKQASALPPHLTWNSSYLKPSNPSSLPLMVSTGARAYALATLLFLSSTITLAQISSSIWVHLSNTSWMWSCNRDSVSLPHGRQYTSNILRRYIAYVLNVVNKKCKVLDSLKTIIVVALIIYQINRSYCNTGITLHIINNDK